MNFSPIVARELNAELRSHRLRKGRFNAGLVTALALATLLIMERWGGGMSLARMMTFAPIAGVIPFMLVVIGLSHAGTLLSVERREGTLQLLLLTHLTGRDIVRGKLAAALVIELNGLLATAPALVLPLMAVGFTPGELWLTLLGCANLLFFALALGLLASLIGDGPQAASWSLLLLLPLLAYSTPFGMLVPRGPVREWLAALQWLNPCAPLAHVQTVAGGVQPSAYWSSLFISHAVAWCLLGLAGLLLPHACRWQAGANAGHRAKKGWLLRSAHRHSFVLRARLLNRNPFLWLTSRARWATTQVWLWVAIPPVVWGWLAWLSWSRGMNLTIVLAMATVATWFVALLVIVPSEACHRLVEDRNSGTLEMILCTPFSVNEIIRGQWLSLGRRYLLPVIAIIFMSATLMTVGYVTYGFGGMLDAEDRGLWLGAWLAGIILLPVCLTALCWVAMRRALFARNVGEASGIAFVQVVGAPIFTLCGIYALGQWAAGWWIILFVVAFVVTVVAMALRARCILLATLRLAAASRYFENPESSAVPIRMNWLWRIRRSSSMTT